MQKMDGLDLELSQTKRHFDMKFKKPQEPKIVKGLLAKGDLIDSLDLNIGYESIQKFQDQWLRGVQAVKQEKVEEQKIKVEEVNQGTIDLDRD